MTKRTIENYILGNWITGDGEGQALYNAISGEIIRYATTKGIDFSSVKFAFQ
jgi:oxepin-CoA hydrolase / 3-oxo-5,6-dehydrosuberyl-CoA semialdehyde dehydrogenase